MINDSQAYECGDGFDEMFLGRGDARPCCKSYVERLSTLSSGELSRRQVAAEHALQNMGITFNVYGHADGREKVWPFDVLPRIIDAEEWIRVEAGLKQRIRALNLFVDDIYNDQAIVRDKAIPEYLLTSATTFRHQMKGFSPTKKVWCHVTGVDLVRDGDGTIYVLEDNLRCPSGVSYVLENREIMKRTFPQVFEGMSVRPVEEYPERLLKTLLQCAPVGTIDPTAVVLTPGSYNSAYFEHTFLAQQMGIQLVQGTDLVVENGYVKMCTTRGLQRVDVIYRRIDDDFLDPKCFREDSFLGVPGLIDVYRAGRVTLANAPGTGIADDKAIYAFVPDIIKYYLDEDPILANVPTYVCSDETQKQHVLANLDKLVVKPTNESGGYGILMGPQATSEQREAYVDLINH
ncbi:MAG: circularly permuted type 2 ATP-grasp protein, partial [Pirellulaceae bacterium]